VTLSDKATKFKILRNGFLSKVPSKAAMRISFPSKAILSHTYAISKKNCPSSIAIKS
jgi:hypothetical protein